MADLYNEIFEIVDSCTFSAKSISPTMWQAFELMHKTFMSGAELYLEGMSSLTSWTLIFAYTSTDMLPALDNFVAYGAEKLLQTPSYLEAVVGMVDEIFHNERVGGVDRICGCKLAESVMLNLRGHVDQYIPKFVELGMRTLTNHELKVKAYRIHLMEMVVNAIYYNPVLTLHILESSGWTNKFFSLWFSNIDNFTRVHDKKLSIAAIVALLTLRADQVPTSVQQGWPRLLQGIVRLFQTLPAAIKSKQTLSRCALGGPANAYLDREEVTKEDFSNEDGLDNDDEDDGEGWEDSAPWTGEGEEVEEDVKDENAAYIEFLNEEVCPI